MAKRFFIAPQTTDHHLNQSPFLAPRNATSAASTIRDCDPSCARSHSIRSGGSLTLTIFLILAGSPGGRPAPARAPPFT